MDMNRSEKTNVATDSDQPEFFIDDQDRYSRLRMIGWWDQSKISNAKVLVVGAGALGNEVLKNLALLGFGNIYIIDMDTIDESNLTRSVLFRSADAGQPKSSVSAKMLREINPDCQVYPLMGNVLAHIGLGLVRDMDVVFGCLDNREARLWVNRMCWKVGTPWIDGGIQEINGVAKVFRPPHGSCYECTMTEMDYKLIALRYSCPLLRQEEILQGKVPTAPTIASMIGALQVQECLKLIHDLPTAESSALVFNGIANRFYKTEFPVNPNCMSHEFYDEDTVSLPLKSESCTLDELFRQFQQTTGKAPTSVELDRDLVVDVKCSACDRVDVVNQPSCLVGSDRALCPKCEQPMTPTLVNRIRADETAKLALNLSQLGIPRDDIVKIHTGENADADGHDGETDSEVNFVHLTGDAGNYSHDLQRFV